MIEFEVTGLSLGASVDVELGFPEGLPEGATYWKFGPRHGNAQPHWFQLDSTVVGNTMRFTLTDGEDGDTDLRRDGTIVDPGAIGVASTSVAPQPVTGGGSTGTSPTTGGGSSGGCSSVAGNAGTDPLLPVLVLLSMVYLLRRLAATTA